MTMKIIPSFVTKLINKITTRDVIFCPAGGILTCYLSNGMNIQVQPVTNAHFTWKKRGFVGIKIAEHAIAFLDFKDIVAISVFAKPADPREQKEKIEKEGSESNIVMFPGKKNQTIKPNTPPEAA